MLLLHCIYKPPKQCPRLNKNITKLTSARFCYFHLLRDITSENDTRDRLLQNYTCTVHSPQSDCGKYTGYTKALCSFLFKRVKIQDTADIAHVNGCLKLQIRYLTKQIQTSQTAENVALEGKIALLA